MDEIRFIATTGALGVGVYEPSLMDALATKPHFIACDAGTTDAGPFSLGSGRPAFNRESVKRDLGAVYRASRTAGIPALIGSVGTAGGDVHVDWMMDIVREVVAAHDWTVKVAVIRSEQDAGYLETLYANGAIRPLNPAPEIDAGTFARSTRIVGMMAVEPLEAALQAGADLIIAGRCSDPALFAAMPVMMGFPPGLAWHAGKVAECGTMACESHGKGVVIGTIRHDEFIIGAVGKGLRCTPQSVAAHGLYENADPYLHTESAGVLDLTNCTYEAVDDTSVRVKGSAFRAVPDYTVKLEGTEFVGYQSLIIGGVRDPYIIAQLDEWLGNITAYIHRSVAEVLKDQLGPDDYKLIFHVYGKNAIMGAREPQVSTLGHEVGIVAEATAPTQELATQIANLCRQPLLHAPIPQWKGGITGFACLHNPAEIERGPVWRFNLNHVAVPARWQDMFRTEIFSLGGAA